MNNRNNGILLKILRFVILAVCIFLLTAWVITGPDVSVQNLIEHSPENSFTAAIVMLILYAFKSITVFFPLIILEITTGYLFSPCVSVLINFAGILIILTIPYGIGRAMGMNVIQKQIQKHPKLGEILDRQNRNTFFLCFFLRIINCLPGDIVTMYLGATNTSFWTNLVAGSLGILPGMLSATFMGESIQDPKSPVFWISTGLTILLAAFSSLFYYFYHRKTQKKGLIVK